MNTHVQQPQSEKCVITKGSDSLGMKTWIMSSKDKPPRPVYVTTKDEENLK